MSESGATTAASMSAIVCTYSDRRWDKLASAIWSLQEQQDPFKEIIVVVDHNPALMTRVRQEFPGVTVIPNVFKKGLSGARNSGVAAASGDIVASLDDDARAEPDWSARIAEVFSKDDIGGAGSDVIPDWEGSRPRWFPEEFLWVVGCSYKGIPKEQRPIRNPLGAAMALRRDLIEEAGGYSTELGRLNKVPLGCEETELCVRIRQRSPDVSFLQSPLARVHHWVPEDRGTWGYFSRRCFAEGLSKAAVSRNVGSSDALEAERAYVARVLPRGIRDGVVAGMRGDIFGPARAGAILLGLGLTAAGYLAGSLRIRGPKGGSEPQRAGWECADLAEQT